MKKPYEEPVLEIELFNVPLMGSTDNVDDDGIVDVGGKGDTDNPTSDWWD